MWLRRRARLVPGARSGTSLEKTERESRSLFPCLPIVYCNAIGGSATNGDSIAITWRSFPSTTLYGWSRNVASAEALMRRTNIESSSATIVVPALLLVGVVLIAPGAGGLGADAGQAGRDNPTSEIPTLPYKLVEW